QLFPRPCHLRVGEYRFPAECCAATFRGGEARLRPLADQAALELGKGVADVVSKLAERGGRVDALGGGVEIDAPRLELLERIERLLELAEGAIQFPDDQRVLGLQARQRRLEAGTL